MIVCAGYKLMLPAKENSNEFVDICAINTILVNGDNTYFHVCMIDSGFLNFQLQISPKIAKTSIYCR